MLLTIQCRLELGVALVNILQLQSIKTNFKKLMTYTIDERDTIMAKEIFFIKSESVLCFE